MENSLLAGTGMTGGGGDAGTGDDFEEGKPVFLKPLQLSREKYL